MAVRQPAPGRRPAQSAASPDPEVERVARLLEEYGERWRALEGYGSYWEGPWEEWFYDGSLASELLLSVAPDGVWLTLDYGPKYDPERRYKRLRLVPPEDARRAAETLVRLERGNGTVTGMVNAIWTEDLALGLAMLEALRRYAPLLGKEYDVPELRPGTGDPYRDFLELLYALRVLDAVGGRAGEDAVAAYGVSEGCRTRVVVSVPVEPPVPVAQGQGWSRRANAAKAVLVRCRGGTAPRITLYEIGEGPNGERRAREVGEILPGYSKETKSLYLSALAAAFLLHLEKEGGLLTRLSEAAAKRARALAPLAGEALLAAEAAALLFG